MPKKHPKHKIPKEFENLERQLKRTLKILKIFVFSVLALALIGLLFGIYLSR